MNQCTARRFLIRGKVQGVGFREGTRREAQRLGLHGLARNLPDGSVEVVAHGSAAALEALRSWLRRGPKLSTVAAVDEAEVEANVDANLDVNLDATSRPARFEIR